MTDKVQKIKDWISKEQDGLMDAQGNFEYPEHEGAYHILCNLDAYIDSMQEEPVSEELEKELSAYVNSKEYTNSIGTSGLLLIARHFANWQNNKMMEDATDVTVHTAGDYPYIPQIELYDYDKDAPLAKEGDKYKVVLIKED